jgi:hypothetical protein
MLSNLSNQPLLFTDFELVLSQDEQGDMVAAINSFRAAVKFAPGNSASWANLATALRDKHNPTVKSDDTEAAECEERAQILERGDHKGSNSDDIVEAAGNSKLVLVNKLMQWRDAKTYCQKLGKDGHLAIIHDSQTQAEVGDSSVFK